MSTYEYGPLDTYEIVWSSGHVEIIEAHQCLMPKSDFFMLAGEKREEPRWTFHGEVEGRWRLLLTAPADDIRSVRNVSHTRDSVDGVQA